MDNLQQQYTKADLDNIRVKEEQRIELARQQEIKNIVNGIIYTVLQDAKTKKNTIMTYSKHQSIPRNINDAVERVNERFPECNVTLETNDHNYTIIIDWS